jgi:hypothetical protein
VVVLATKARWSITVRVLLSLAVVEKKRKSSGTS